MEKECPICGGLFYTENKNRKYCDDCAAHTQARRNGIERAERRIYWRTKEPKLFFGKCDECGKDFKTAQYLLFSQWNPETRKKVVFCSRKCRKAWLHTHDVYDYCGKPLKEDYYAIPELEGSKFCAKVCAERYIRCQRITIKVPIEKFKRKAAVVGGERNGECNGERVDAVVCGGGSS